MIIQDAGPASFIRCHYCPKHYQLDRSTYNMKRHLILDHAALDRVKYTAMIRDLVDSDNWEDLLNKGTAKVTPVKEKSQPGPNYYHASDHM